MNKKITDYILRLFTVRFPYYNYNMKKNEVLQILYDEVCKSDEIKIYSVSEIVDGLADEKIIELIENHFRNEKKELWSACKNLKNNVRGVIEENEIVNYSEDIYDYIVDNVVAKLVVYYDYRELNEGSFNEKIQILYEEEKKSVINVFLDNIRRVLNTEVESFGYVGDGISQKKLEKYILDIIMEKANYKLITELNTGKSDGFILKLAELYINKNRVFNPDTYSHIASILVSKTQEKFSEFELEFYTKNIDKALRGRGYNSKEIIFSETEKEILELYTYFKQRRQSVIEEKKRKKEERIKHNTKKRKMFKGLIALAVTGTLIGSSFVTKEIVEVVQDKVTDVKYRFASSEMGGNEYESVFTKHSNEFRHNAKIIVENYNKYGQLGDIYGYLAFYEAYKNVFENRLAIMDAYLTEVKVEHNLDVGYKYYIEFMYDRLVELGCKEVQKEKYIDVVERYKIAAEKNTNSDKTTWECLSDSDKKLIEDIRDLYDNYSAKSYIELTELGKSSLENSSGRRI